MSTPIGVCLYYLEQEIYTPGLQAGNDNYFNQVLAYVRDHGPGGLSSPEMRVLVAAAKRRNSLNELDEAVLPHGA